MQFFQYALSFMSSLAASNSTLAHVLYYAITIATYALTGINALTAFWAALVALFTAMSSIPGLSFLATWASTLSEDEATVSSFENSFLLPLLNQLSITPLPTVPSTPSASTTPAAS